MLHKIEHYRPIFSWAILAFAALSLSIIFSGCGTLNEKLPKPPVVNISGEASKNETNLKDNENKLDKNAVAVDSENVKKLSQISASDQVAKEAVDNVKDEDTSDNPDLDVASSELSLNLMRNPNASPEDRAAAAERYMARKNGEISKWKQLTSKAQGQAEAQNKEIDRLSKEKNDLKKENESLKNKFEKEQAENELKWTEELSKEKKYSQSMYNEAQKQIKAAKDSEEKARRDRIAKIIMWIEGIGGLIFIGTSIALGLSLYSGRFCGKNVMAFVIGYAISLIVIFGGMTIDYIVHLWWFLPLCGILIVLGLIGAGLWIWHLVEKTKDDSEDHERADAQAIAIQNFKNDSLKAKDGKWEALSPYLSKAFEGIRYLEDKTDKKLDDIGIDRISSKDNRNKPTQQ